MADAIVINADGYFDRLQQFYTQWKADKRSSDGVFGGADSIVVLAGKAEQESSYQKHNAFHFWLLGYEFPATLMVLTQAAMHVVTTTKKAKHLEPLKGNNKLPIEIFEVDTKKPETRTESFEKCLDIIKGAGKKVGTIAKTEATGPFADEWKKLFGDISKEVEEVDITQALSAAFAIKDETELRCMRSASRACSGILSDYWVEEMSEALDSEKKVSHASLAKKIADKIEDPAIFRKISKLPSDFDDKQLDWAYGPVIQSGGHYDLSFDAQSDKENLHSGTIIAGLGFRYKTYCSVLARTFLIDPSKSQTAYYKILVAAHDAAMKEIRDGVVIKDVYNKTLGVVKSKKPELERHFGKDVGAAIGIELKDSVCILNGKNSKTLKDGMTLSVSTSFSNLINDKPQDKRGTNYSLLITDTVRVSKGEPAIFTKDTSAELDSIEFYFKDDEDEPTPKKDKAKKPASSAVATANIKTSRLRGADRNNNAKEEEDARRRAHQKELAQKKQQQGQDKYPESTGDTNGITVKKFKKFESYKRENQLPARIKDMIVWVDTKASTVILPIMGRPVPFHINTIKNVSKTEEGEHAHLRFNFLSPGQGVGRKDDQPFEDPQAHFVRSLTIRSKDMDRLQEVSSQITELRKSAVRRDQEQKELEDVVELEKLVEIRNRRPIKLSEVYLRPAQDGKRVAGELEIHQNGLRYLSPLRNDHIDVVFSNVQHLFFQPCVGELVVIIHIHLKNPIMIGKRKTRDIQFYRDATDMAFDETQNRKRKHRYGDEDEFEAEQEERRRRAELDKQFKSFAEKIEMSDGAREYNIGVDVPFREVAFHGVPNRSNVLMAPTTDALVQLTEAPFTVITLEEIEIAHLERIQYGLKNFDLVFVFKDFHRTPAHVNTIPVESLDRVKEWLDSVDVAYTEGPLNLSWAQIMKTIIADPHEFFKSGGWDFLATDSDAENESEESEESAFEMDDSDLAASESESDDESDFDDNASADEGEEDSELEEEGEDWDEMETKAKRADREVGHDDEEKPKKRKR